jgi:hypothetical protein
VEIDILVAVASSSPLATFRFIEADGRVNRQAKDGIGGFLVAVWRKGLLQIHLAIDMVLKWVATVIGA